METRWGQTKLALFLIISILIIGSASAVGMGVSTPTLFFKNILRGGYAEAVVTASNPNNYDLVPRIFVTGDIEEWVTLTPANGVFMVPANSNGEFIVSVNPPAFVRNGVYNGRVAVVTGPPPGTQSGGSSISVGAAIDIIIEVSDEEVQDVQMRKLVVDPSEECGKVTFRITTKNIGNVEATPIYSIELYTKDSQTLLKDLSGTFDTLKPTVTRRDFIQMDTELDQFKCIPKGEYIAKVVGTSGNIEFYSGKVGVQIVERGTLSVEGALEEVIHTNEGFMGEPLKIVGKFNNTGVTSEDAQLRIEAYKGDRLVSFINGDKRIAESESVTELEAFYVPTEIGEYTLKSTVLFGTGSTRPSNSLETGLVVSFGLTMMLMLVGVPLFIVVVIVVIIYKRKQRGY